MPRMSKAQFGMIADVVRELDDVVDRESREEMAIRFADELRRTNERFDEARFFDACGMPYLARASEWERAR